MDNLAEKVDSGVVMQEMFDMQRHWAPRSGSGGMHPQEIFEDAF